MVKEGLASPFGPREQVWEEAVFAILAKFGGDLATIYALYTTTPNLDAAATDEAVPFGQRVWGGRVRRARMDYCQWGAMVLDMMLDKPLNDRSGLRQC